jgi:hypothetical protein
MILPLRLQIRFIEFKIVFQKHQNVKFIYRNWRASGKWRARQAIEEALKNVLYYRDIEGTTNVFYISLLEIMK